MNQNKRQPPDELMQKKRMLDENEQLQQLYRALVPTSIISVDEFWKEIASQYKQTMGPQQDVGVSGAFLVSPYVSLCFHLFGLEAKRNFQVGLLGIVARTV